MKTLVVVVALLLPVVAHADWSVDFQEAYATPEAVARRLQTGTA